MAWLSILGTFGGGASLQSAELSTDGTLLSCNRCQQNSDMMQFLQKCNKFHSFHPVGHYSLQPSLSELIQHGLGLIANAIKMLT